MTRCCVTVVFSVVARTKYYAVYVFSSHSSWTSSWLDVPAGVTQEEAHTGFPIHLLSAVRALIFLARRIQLLFLPLVDREVDAGMCESSTTKHSCCCFWFTLFLAYRCLVTAEDFGTMRPKQYKSKTLVRPAFQPLTWLENGGQEDRNSRSYRHQEGEDVGWGGI